MGGLILGRSPALWYGFGVAVLNVLVVVVGLPLSTEGLAAIDAVLALGLALLANSSDPRTVPTFALTTSAASPTTSSGGTSSGTTGSPSSAPTGDGPIGPADPSGDTAEPTDPATAPADPAATVAPADSPSAG